MIQYGSLPAICPILPAEQGGAGKENQQMWQGCLFFAIERETVD